MDAVRQLNQGQDKICKPLQCNWRHWMSSDESCCSLILCSSSAGYPRLNCYYKLVLMWLKLALESTLEFGCVNTVKMF